MVLSIFQLSVFPILFTVSHLSASYLRCLWFLSAFDNSGFSCLKKMSMNADQFLIQEIVCGHMWKSKSCISLR